MHIKVRQAGLGDAEVIAPLFDGYRQFYAQAPDPALALSFIRERLALLESVIFLAEDASGRVLGFTQLFPSFSSVGARRIWVLNDLFVDSAARGTGVGRALLDAARTHAALTGALRIELATAHDNPAQKLYESQGYLRETGVLHYSLAVD
ncbi:MAG TPA: GNAT family N-acetyltransferase [Noviherbaspirillum sp.]|jgi:GNAT superfamily N-acetyltransferase|uniref:GNAT family N-acetyltransferase n=1 Tax=Noviherbaspirillum sp. TaxID=1926288 RepID=UPI002F94939B